MDNEKIVAVIKEQMKRDKEAWDKGKVNHRWKSSKCALCQAFISCTCEDCPFGAFKNHCGGFFYSLGYNDLLRIPIEHMISFLTQMKMYYEEKE